MGGSNPTSVKCTGGVLHSAAAQDRANRASRALGEPEGPFLHFLLICLPFWGPGGIPEGGWGLWLRPDKASAQMEAPGPVSCQIS